MATYADLAEFKRFLRSEAPHEDDDLFQMALDAAEYAVDLACDTAAVVTDPPPTVKLAVLVQASRWVKRRDAPFGIAGSPEMGSEMRLLARLDPDVAVLLGGWGEMPRAGGTT